MYHAATQKFNQMHPIKCPHVFFHVIVDALSPVTFDPLLSAHYWQAPGQFVHVCACLWACVGGCVTECGTNERSDYSLMPRVIISSPWIKRQIKPTAGRGEADHVDICFYSGKEEKLQEFEEGRKRAAHLVLKARCLIMPQTMRTVEQCFPNACLHAHLY